MYFMREFLILFHHLSKAYKFAIDTVGIDFFKSHEIWGDYLKYL